MKITQCLPVVLLTAILAACNGPAGELVGVRKPGNFKEANPYGMVFIKKGSFMMGENAQSAVFNQPDNIGMRTVNAFWMDETEVTHVAGVSETVQTVTIATNPDATLVVLDDRHDVAANQGDRVVFVALVVIDGVTYSLLVLRGKDIETLVVGANPDAT